ncbi:winged helix-turn-helix domain-containing protein [Halorientalis sp. IM1011]|uniref:helix-turn-helix transcriptional regulator n=1 Tax=Halorientalis sp. IM1011 TaxID=1932360 RepID=UPI001560924F|nr:helix-turn-helix domain-containing protein [Halorientalis sp. IM1011]
MKRDDVIDVIRREPVLRTLRRSDTVLRQSDLTDRLDLSKSTAHRAIATLEDLGAIERVDGGYALTALGAVLADETTGYLTRIDRIGDLAVFLDVIEELPFDLDDFEAYSVTHATVDNPTAPMIRLAELTERSTTVRVVTSSLAPQSFDAGRHLLRQGELTSAMVLDRRAFDSLIESERYGADLAADLRETPLSLYRHDDPIPFQLGLMDGTLCLGANDRNRRPEALLETSSDAAVSTGEALFEQYRDRAERITPADV